MFTFSDGKAVFAAIVGVGVLFAEWKITQESACLNTCLLWVLDGSRVCCHCLMEGVLFVEWKIFPEILWRTVHPKKDPLKVVGVRGFPTWGWGWGAVCST